MDQSISSTNSYSVDFSSIDYSNYDPDNLNNTNEISLKFSDNLNKSNEISFNSDDKNIILSVFWKNGMLGAASYNSHLSEIQLLHDIVESNLDFKILSALFMQVQPTNIVVCNLQDRNFLKIIKQLAHGGKINVFTNLNETDDLKSDEKVHILPKQYFKYKNCEQLVLSIPLASAPKNEESRKLYVRSLVNFTQELAVCALGALLFFMDTPLAKLNLPTNIKIMSLRILNMDNLVWIDDSTYESLQIFSMCEHKSTYKLIKKFKKKVPSIFGLLNRCNSVLGSIYLKTILAQPTKNLNVLQYRHEVIEFCLKPCNKSAVLSMINCIKHCHCVLFIMVKMCGGNVSIYQWKLLYQTVINAVTIGEICGRYSERITFFRKIKETLKNSLYNMINCMSCVIDFEQSTMYKRFVVKAGFIPELDEKKSKFVNMSHILDEIALQELKKLPPYIRECSIQKIPEVGFLLCLPLWKPSSEMTENDYQIDNFEFKWLLTDNVYYKTSRCYELDKLFGQIELSIIQEEIQIMVKLTEYITQNWIADLHEILSLIAELDCLIGFADVAQDLKLIKPVILPKEYCKINIVNGRHILQEKFVNVFIPNSYNSSKINHLIKVIAGFNSSGKSVYLKQIGLIAYLSHIGCYVPAEYTEISVLDHIYTRIQSTESLSTLMSAFMVDLRQMSVALNGSTSRSLVIIDEFGKGTSEINGLALLLASLSNFVHRPFNVMPHVIISTHFHSLPNLLQQIIHRDVYHNIKYLSMCHKIENLEIICLYKVVDKLENQVMSMAFNIAALNGLPTYIVERATQILQLIQCGRCVKPIVENLRYKLLFRRKQFIENVLDLMQDGIMDSSYKDLMDDLENIRYP